MSSVSGFEGLADALALEAKVELVSIRREANVYPKRRDLQWAIKKLGFVGTEKEKTAIAPLSPFWNEQNKDLTQLVIKVFEASPSNTFLLLMALEDQFDAALLKVSAQLRKRIIVVAHQPPAWYRLNWRDFTAFNGLGGIVCVSESQKDFFSKVTVAPLLGIKHGVKSDFFSPQPLPEFDGGKRLLFVGQWLRDLDLLEQAMHFVWRQQPDTKLDCVIPRAARSHPALYRLACDERVAWHADLDADTLRNLYRRATLLFLPLIDSTANNAIIEALASGLAIVSTRVGGVEEYVHSEFGELCTIGDVFAHAEAVLRWLDDAGRRAKAGALGRDFAVQNLDWGRISGDLLNQLESIVA